MSPPDPSDLEPSSKPPQPASSGAITAQDSPQANGRQKRISQRQTAPDAPTSVGDPHEEDSWVGFVIGDRYVLKSILGEGGMGRVYLAHHKVINKALAVKILHPEFAKDKEAVGRFLQEARAASSVGNPHIVDISDFGKLDDGSTYFVMEFLDGKTLAHLLDEKGRLEPAFICDIVQQLCNGLAAAHAQQIVHRDLKPENITLVSHGGRENFCKILDFGIAKVSTNTSKLTKAGSVFGTPHYMSPEQSAGAAVDHRADIYALGVMMYEMVTGELPFNADNFMGILTQHMYKAPAPIRALQSGAHCPPGLEAIILKCMEKTREGRYQSTTELAADIGCVMRGEEPSAARQMQGSTHASSSGMLSQGAPSSKSRVSRLAIYAAVGLFFAVATALTLRANLNRNAPPTRPATPPAVAAKPESAPTTKGPSPAAAPEKPAAAPEKPATPVTTNVLVHSEPLGATLVIGKQSHPLPHMLELEVDKPVQGLVSLPGYVSQSVTIDGSTPKIKVQLKAQGKRPKRLGQSPPPSKPPAKQKSEKKPAGMVEPW